MATSARELFSAFLAVYRHVSSGAVPADKVAEISVRGVGKFGDVREELKRLPGGVRFCLEWCISDSSVDTELWAGLLDVSRQTSYRIEALRWACDLLGTSRENAEYDLRWVASILPQVRKEFQSRYGSGTSAAKRDIEAYVALQEQRRHVEVLENWAGLANANEGAQPTAAPTRPTVQTPPKEVELVIEPTTQPVRPMIELDADPTAQPVVSPMTIELESQPAPAPKRTAPAANALDLQSFSVEQLRALAQARVPGASDEIVRRMQAG